MSRLQRSGLVRFHDASLQVWEEPGGRVEPEWQRLFKRDVFARIVQQMNRLGWICVVPADMVQRYGESFARNYRHCRKGDLQAELSIGGRQIELKMWQNVTNVSHPNGGEYDFGKEGRMPYLLRLEMERTRRRIRDYLCNVFEGYRFEPSKPVRGFAGLTALAWIEHSLRKCWHYKPLLGRRDGEDCDYNNKSADCGRVIHGARVWTTDWKGRVVTGTAYYNINNMWWVITGKYECMNVASFEIYIQNPGKLRCKRNAKARRQRLEGELQGAIKAMNFERAAKLRNILFPTFGQAPEALAA